VRRIMVCSIGSAPRTLNRVAAGSVFYHHFSRPGVSSITCRNA
jgi:hypothetical protein